MAESVTDPLPPVPAATVAERTSARVDVFSVFLTDAPEPAADTPVAPLAAATLRATPKARASICCRDSALIVTSPRAAIVADSTAARTELVTLTTLRAAPTVTPTAAVLPSATPSPAPPALESTRDVSEAVIFTIPSVVTVADPRITASVSTARRLVLPAPAPESPTAAALPLATCPVPAIVQEVIEGLASAATVRSPLARDTVASSISAETWPRFCAVPISLLATDTPTATDRAFEETCAARAPATALMAPESSASTVRLLAVTFALPATVAFTSRTTVFKANEPAPTNDSGSAPVTPLPEPVERAPLTPTAQALIVPPVAAWTVTAPPVLVTVARSMVAVT